MIIEVENGTVKEALYEGITKQETKDFLCHKGKCDVCEEDLWQDNFIVWEEAQLIAICGNCAERVIAGLSRDIYELKGHIEAKRQKGERYGVIFLQREIATLQEQRSKYSRRIVELQEILSRRD